MGARLVPLWSSANKSKNSGILNCRFRHLRNILNFYVSWAKLSSIDHFGSKVTEVKLRSCSIIFGRKAVFGKCCWSCLTLLWRHRSRNNFYGTVSDALWRAVSDAIRVFPICHVAFEIRGGRLGWGLILSEGGGSGHSCSESYLPPLLHIRKRHLTKAADSNYYCSLEQ